LNESSTIINIGEALGCSPALTEDPVTTFGALLNGCIDDYCEKTERRMLVEGTLLLLLGVASAFLTNYMFSFLGIFV